MEKIKGLLGKIRATNFFSLFFGDFTSMVKWSEASIHCTWKDKRLYQKYKILKFSSSFGFFFQKATFLSYWKTKNIYSLSKKPKRFFIKLLKIKCYHILIRLPHILFSLDMWLHLTTLHEYIYQLNIITWG